MPRCRACCPCSTKFACAKRCVPAGPEGQINLYSVFDRKNYFYPTCRRAIRSASSYQPVVGEGSLIIDMEDGTPRVIGIERIHLEQDAGKSRSTTCTRDRTYVDLNRTGVALMEIVSKPDLRAGDEAAAYMPKLRSICAISAPATATWRRHPCARRQRFGAPPGARTTGRADRDQERQLVRFIRQNGIEYEARRQVEVLEDGGDSRPGNPPLRPGKGETRSMRSKEEAHDYRYFPDPDSAAAAARSGVCRCRLLPDIPELPDREARAVRGGTTACRPMTQAFWLRRRKRATSLRAVAKGRDAKLAANWVMGESVRCAEQGRR